MWVCANSSVVVSLSCSCKFGRSDPSRGGASLYEAQSDAFEKGSGRTWTRRLEFQPENLHTLWTSQLRNTSTPTPSAIVYLIHMPLAAKRFSFDKVNSSRKRLKPPDEDLPELLDDYDLNVEDQEKLRNLMQETEELQVQQADQQEQHRQQQPHTLQLGQQLSIVAPSIHDSNLGAVHPTLVDLGAGYYAVRRPAPAWCTCCLCGQHTCLHGHRASHDGRSRCRVRG